MDLIQFQLRDRLLVSPKQFLAIREASDRLAASVISEGEFFTVCKRICPEIDRFRAYDLVVDWKRKD